MKVRRVLQQQLKKMDLRVTLQLCGSAKAPVDLKQITYLGLSVRIITLSASLFSRPLVESASFCWGRCLFLNRKQEGLILSAVVLEARWWYLGSKPGVGRSWSTWGRKISKLMSIDSSIEAAFELNSFVYAFFAKDSSLMVIIPVKPWNAAAFWDAEWIW